MEGVSIPWEIGHKKTGRRGDRETCGEALVLKRVLFPPVRVLWQIY